MRIMLTFRQQTLQNTSHAHTCRLETFAGPVGKELLKAAATEGLEAFKGGLEWQAAAAEAEQAAFRVCHS